MREMKDSGVEWIGEIPIDWHVSKIKFVAKSNQDTLAEDTPATQMIDYIDIGSVTYTNGIELVQKYPFDEAPSRARRIVHAGDTIISTVRTYLKAVAYIEIEYDSFITSTGFSVLTPNQGLNSKYLYYAISSHSFISEVESNSVGISYPAINNSVLVGLKSAFPPLKTQHRIADYLDAKCAQIDRAIARQQEVIEKLKEYKLSVITEAVTKGLNPDVPMKDSGIEWIGEIPEGWDTLAFGRVAQVKSNLVDPSLYPDLPQISPESIEKDSGRLLSYSSVDESGVFSYNHYFYTGQILYSKIRPKLNKACIAPFEGLCSADMYPIETNADTRFILYCIISYSFLSQVIMVTESRVKMPKINQSELARIMIALPPEKQTQEQIVEYLDRFCEKLDSTLDRKRVLIDKLTEYKKSLIYEVVTGKREV